MKAVLTQVGRWVTFKNVSPLCPPENCRAHLITGSSSLVVFNVHSSGKMAQLVKYLPPEQDLSLIPECPEHWLCWTVYKARAGEAGIAQPLGLQFSLIGEPQNERPCLKGGQLS